MATYQKILVALDLHDDVEVVFKQAVFLAKHYQAELHAIHVMPHVISSVPYAYDFQTEMEKDADERLSQLKELTDLTVQTHLIAGSPRREILEKSTELEADLLIVGSHGKHGVELILGSTANGVLHGSPCDVLTVRIDYSGRGEAHGPYKHLVVATDLRPDNQKTLDRAKALSSDFGSDIHMINVVPDEATLASLYVPNMEEDLAKEAEEQMAKMAQEMGIPETDAKVLRGHPKAAILEYDAECGSDLLVIGSHGRPLLEAAFLGSTANACLHGAKHDVLVIKI